MPHKPPALLPSLQSRVPAIGLKPPPLLLRQAFIDDNVVVDSNRQQHRQQQLQSLLRAEHDDNDDVALLRHHVDVMDKHLLTFVKQNRSGYLSDSESNLTGINSCRRATGGAGIASFKPPALGAGVSDSVHVGGGINKAIKKRRQSCHVTLCEPVTSTQSSCSCTVAPETNSCVLTSLTTNTCNSQTEQATNTTSQTAHPVSDHKTAASTAAAAAAAQTSTSIQQPAQAASNVVSSSVHGAAGGKCACGLPNPQFCTLNLLNAINTSSMKAPRRSWVPISVCSTYE